MGQACCSYQPKDGQNENFGAKGSIEKKQLDKKIYNLPADQAAKVMAKAKAHEPQVIKMQAVARGFLVRVKTPNGKKRKNLKKGGKRASDKGMSDLE